MKAYATMNPTSEVPQFKTCSRCKQMLLASAENFSPHKRSADGLTYDCHICRRLIAEKRRRELGMKERVTSSEKNGLKLCLVCGKWMPSTVEYFQIDKRRNQFISMCHDCRKTQQRASDRLRFEERKQYRLNNANRIRVRNQAYRAKTKGKQKLYTLRYTLKNPAIKKITKQRYRARKNNLPASWKRSDWQRALNYFQGCCAYCGNPPGLFNHMIMAAEHFVPLTDQNCPGTVPENIVPACKSCNSSKSTKPAEQWLAAKFGKRKASIILKRIEDYFASLDSAN